MKKRRCAGREIADSMYRDIAAAAFAENGDRIGFTGVHIVNGDSFLSDSSMR